MKSNFVWLGIAVLAIASTGCVDRNRQEQAKKTQELVTNSTVAVQTQPVQVRTIGETLSVTGELTTSEDTQVGAKRSGRLTAVYVNQGDSVAAGQLLASIDSSDIQSQVQQALAALSGAQALLSQARLNAAVGPTKSTAAVNAAQAQLRSAQAQLKKAKAGARPEERIQVDWQVKSAKSNLDTVEKDLARKKALFDQGAISRAQLDVAQNAYMSALTQYNAVLQTQAITTEGTRSEDLMVAQEAVRTAQQNLEQAKASKQLDAILGDQVVTAQAQVDTARAQVKIAQQALADAQIRAPFAGRVADKPMQAGTVVSPGQGIVRLIGSSGLYFEGDVPESTIDKVQPGKTVEVRIDALPGKSFAGYVAAVSPVGQGTGRLFSARIQINGNLAGLKPGMFATGNILLRSVPGAMVVPASAIVQRDGKSVVFVVDGNKARQKEVQPGLTQGGYVQVQGLSTGDQVVITGQQNLVDGAQVSVDPVKVASMPPKETKS